jgi:hypothetical protein
MLCGKRRRLHHRRAVPAEGAAARGRGGFLADLDRSTLADIALRPDLRLEEELA